MNEQIPSEQDIPDGTTSQSAKSPDNGDKAAGYAAAPHNPVANIVSRMSIMQMTLAVVLVVFLWQWFDAHRQIGNVQQELARRLAEMEGNNKASQMLVKQEQDSLRDLSAKVALLEARYAEAQNQRAALETLYQELSSSRDETVLAQVEQMLLIAGQQLQLSANVKAALIAMQQADEYLKRMDRASMNGLRKAISRDMDKLRVLPNVDVPGINLHLDNLIAAVDTLPLAQDIRVPQEAGTPASVAPAGSGWQKLLHEIWEEAKHLVRIENVEKHELPLLPPTQIFFLRENLKLRLLSARLALLAHDEASFRHDLQAAQEWVARYFDAKSTQGALAVTTLQKMRASSINIEVPDVSSSLEAVRNYRVSREVPREKQAR
ncbi:MAG: uroporphyrinogen-III C-methyltransferase [Gallionellaceae bacterium]|nr:uroporphyrinogen-III C-methyltransferase [Gallionellaceae bacterium]